MSGGADGENASSRLLASDGVISYNSPVLPLKRRDNRLPARVGGEQLEPSQRLGVLGEKKMCMLDEIRAKRDEIYAIAKRHKAEKLWVFGSCARKEEHPDSDVDFLVKFSDSAEFGSQVALGDDFNAYFGRKVDVVSDRGLSPYIGKLIRKEALPV